MNSTENNTEFLHLRIRALEKENDRLRSLLATYNAKELQVNYQLINN